MESFAEIGKKEALRRLYAESGYHFGDKCSFESSDKEKVVTVSKMFSEGLDFDLVYFPLKHLGYKTVVMATGELYSQLCEARVLSIVIGVSAKLDYQQISLIWSGITEAAGEFGYKKVSLDLLPSRNGLSISVCATGAVRTEHIAAVKAPSSKDLLCVTGNLGAAYIGLQALENEKTKFDGKTQPDLEKYKRFVSAYLKPELKAHFPTLLREAGYVPSCVQFVERGLADAMLQIASDTDLGVKVYADRIPFAGDSFDVAEGLGADAMTAALNGGDDARLLFTIPLASYEDFRRDFQEFEIIGHLALPEAGTVIVLPDGVELPVKAQGWKTEE
ncbi:MAG: hypothetical protein MJY62_02035 [Bacteroidales bacterium]|nr:hypothetical protein [Bacteroidales bacterium]